MSSGENHLGEHRLARNLLIVLILNQKLEWVVKLFVFAVIHHQNSVSINNRDHSMGYDQDSGVVLWVVEELLPKLGLNQIVCLKINIGCCLIKHHDFVALK
jgi:hypothetical protein